MSEWVIAIAAWCSLNAGVGSGNAYFNVKEVLQWEREYKQACQQHVFKCVLDNPVRPAQCFVKGEAK